MNRFNDEVFPLLITAAFCAFLIFIALSFSGCVNYNYGVYSPLGGVLK